MGYKFGIVIVKIHCKILLHGIPLSMLQAVNQTKIMRRFLQKMEWACGQ